MQIQNLKRHTRNNPRDNIWLRLGTKFLFRDFENLLTSALSIGLESYLQSNDIYNDYVQ